MLKQRNKTRNGKRRRKNIKVEIDKSELEQAKFINNYNIDSVR